MYGDAAASAGSDRIGRSGGAMIVIGGKNSANTDRLAQVCREQDCPTYHIETAAELDTAYGSVV